MIILKNYENMKFRKRQTFFATVVDVVELKDNNYAIGLDAQDQYGMHFGILYILCVNGKVTGNMFGLLESNGWYQFLDKNYVSTEELREELMGYTAGIVVDFSSNEPQIVQIFCTLGLEEEGFEIDDEDFGLIPKCPQEIN